MLAPKQSIRVIVLVLIVASCAQVERKRLEPQPLTEGVDGAASMGVAAATSVHQEIRNGSARDAYVESLPFARAGLTTFELRYWGPFGPVDHHVRDVAAGFMGQGGEWKTWVELSDNRGDDWYEWTAIATELPPETTFHEASGHEWYGRTRMLIPAVGKVPVLTGFSIIFNCSDHHLRTMEVRLFDEGNHVYVETDFKDDEHREYTYNVAYALVPREKVSRTQHFTGTATGSVTRSRPRGLPVLQGFQLSFKDADHHIRQIGIRLDPENLVINYGDYNHDDKFDYDVWWAELAGYL